MKVFAKRFYGFDPARSPLVSFGLAGNRDALINASSPGDLILFVGTQDDPTSDRERGRLLGLAEFARIAVDTKAFVDPARLRSFDLKADGSLVWPWSLPILRAWTFDEPRFKLVDILKEQLTFEATVRAVPLDEHDIRAVLAIPRRELILPRNEALERLKGLSDALAQGRPTTGPKPVAWNATVSHDPNAEAWTYALRFGRRAIWKVGHTQDLNVRLAEINLHIPFEEIGERWIAFMHHRWTCSQDAYAMEQRVFGRLNTFRTVGERMRCTESELTTAWVASLSAQ